eukprot:TRINITY_DN1421_c0_g3_i2.p1 TRINITY_DN1421_c0_g3~~TRINITY_DN1421_c0_g3_i2.p1  ORF type:complete len:286 (+),score=74.01 TRINITY_DN1421_c0_g3_i2:82-939(+)
MDAPTPAFDVLWAAFVLLLSSGTLLVLFFRHLKQVCCRSCRMEGKQKEGVVLFHTIPSHCGVPGSISPFCLKLETFFKMAGVRYERSKCKKRAPKGKFPFIELNGKRIGDSDRIIKHLVENGLANDLDIDLPPEKKALGFMIRQMVEEHLYFILVYFRWVDDEGWEVFREHLKPMFPIPIPCLRDMVMSLVRRRVKSMLNAQGIARHSREEIVEMGKETITALSDLLEDQKYFLSSMGPTSLDSAVFGALANVVFDPIDTELFSFCRSQANITEYVRRIKAEHWN